MTDFLHALTDPHIPFLRYAMIVGVMAGVAFGVIGTYVVTRRISYIAGAISHSVLGGIGAALYCQKQLGWSWCHPMLGAVLAALLSAAIIGVVSMTSRQREDTVIGAMWALGMAAGLLFIAKTPGYIDAMSYLFGNILMISRTDLWIVGALDLVVVATGMLCYEKFLAICFDEEFALLRGVPTRFYYLLLLGLTALTVVLLVSVVGIVMVIALLTLPAAVASHCARRLWQMMILSVLFCMLFTTSGVTVSYLYDTPTGPTIILIAGAVYLVSAVFCPHRLSRK